MFSDALPEDKELRQQLQRRRLVRERGREIERFIDLINILLAQEAILEIQQAEREDSTFSHRCLFCRDVFTGNRALLFQHMLEDHSFNVGQPDNLGMNFNETMQLTMIILLLFSVRRGVFGHAAE